MNDRWTDTTLFHDLRALGVRPGDVLMVHASLRAIGLVKEGALGVLDALDAAIAPGGTLLMVLGARDELSWVNQEVPEDERPARLAGAEPFDARRTPAQLDIGALAEAFRQRPTTLVSDHPEGRFGASGVRATELLREVPWNDFYGPGSPLERFCQMNGRVLRLGAHLNTATVLHYAEYLVDLPVKRRVRRYRRVVASPEPVIRVIECLDDSSGIVDWPGDDYFGLILSEFLAGGHARTGKVGNAPSELIEAAGLVSFGVEWMKRNFTPLSGSLST